MPNKEKINKDGWMLPTFFFKKYWFWFENPFDVSDADMVNFFSYDDVNVSGFTKKTGLTTLIDLNCSLDEIWSRMRKDFIRKQISKGEKNGISVIKDTNFRKFKKIYKRFRKDKNIQLDNYSFFRKYGILFSAYYKDEMIAGGIFISKNKIFRAWALASKRLDNLNGKDREIIGQANRMVIWEAIKYAKESGHSIFDLGGINPDSDKKGEITLAEFKEAFGGEKRTNYFYFKIYSKILLLVQNFKRALH